MKKQEQSLFWADQMAREMETRKDFHYLGKGFKPPKKFTVKTSASISGVLHIGRLSDTIRGESVYRALKDLGLSAELIWVAEDMDPLRKIPKGVPQKFSKYLGMPVTDVPDPWGCHKSYAEHHLSDYLTVISEFVSAKMPRYSMREEYKKGNFKKYIEILLNSTESLKAILNKHRREPLTESWSPWQPICNGCGKIMTPRVKKFEDRLVHYSCQDYKFEKTTAKGCGHEGINDPLKDEGKLVWKSEWAAQWARWKVSSEGAGKEYQVPGSAFWINGEICERILSCPEPKPIFYEHLIIDGQKMSASLGNVVYPKDWIEVAEPELLRFLYNKKLMKTRSFTWQGLPMLYNDYDYHARIYSGKEKPKNPKEEKHMKRLFELSQLKGTKKTSPISFDFAAMVASVFSEGQEDSAIQIFERSGHLNKPSAQVKDLVLSRLKYARKWVKLHGGDDYQIKVADKPDPKAIESLNKDQKNALRDLSKTLSGKELSEQELYNSFWEISKKNNLPAPEFFRAVYRVLINKDSGPRLAPFILALGQERVSKIILNI